MNSDFIHHLGISLTFGEGQSPNLARKPDLWETMHMMAFISTYKQVYFLNLYQ